MKLLVTGGAGFIGSHFARRLLNTRSDVSSLTVLDSLTYAGTLRNIEDLFDFRSFRFIHADVSDKSLPADIFEGLDAIVNFAAESHVDRSISESGDFIRTNIEGTHNLLTLAHKFKAKKFIQISTDEVYGSIPIGAWSENSPLLPNSPYAASKASADLIVRAFHQTFGLRTIITRCSNNYGTHQYPEKFIPVAIRSVLEGKPIPIYGNGLNRRDWLSVADHCRAIELAMDKGKSGEIYNIGGGTELTNLDLAKKIISLMGGVEDGLTFVDDRKGHDQRYAVNYSKISTACGYAPIHNIDSDLLGIINWYKDNRDWWVRA
jgi:dTDP-glucose 4,6-dehydratase